MPAGSLQITSYRHSDLSKVIATGDTSFPKTYYSPGKMPVTVYTAADVTALGANWFPYPVYE